MEKNSASKSVSCSGLQSVLCGAQLISGSTASGGVSRVNI